MNEQAGPKLHLRDFEGPLDLLLTLIEQHEIDIMDIPIAELTRQYMSYLDGLSELDVEEATEFLVIASDLLRLKARLLMPAAPGDEGEEEDPRQELVFRLLAYRRTRYMALYLRTQAAIGRYMVFRLRETPAHLGLDLRTPEEEQEQELEESFSMSKLYAAMDRMTERNKLRYQDVSEKLRLLTKRESISLKERIVQTFEAIVQRGRCLFRDLFPRNESVTGRVNGFLAVLELVRQRRIDALQTSPESDIELVNISRDALDTDVRELGQSIEKDYR